MFDKDSGPYTVEEIRSLLVNALDWAVTLSEVPATTPQTCGNYHLHNLEIAKWWASEYKRRLLEDFHSEYTKLQVKLENGMQFADA